MALKTRKALISLKSFSSQGLVKLESAAKQISLLAKMDRISSVYRVDRAAESFLGLLEYDSFERLEGYAVVIACSGDLVAEQWATELKLIEANSSDQSSRRTLSINLLLVEDVIMRTPGLTLPHPEFHLRPEEIIPASEIAPDLVHPILKRPLNDLARAIQNQAWGEFHCQGHMLLDNQK